MTTFKSWIALVIAILPLVSRAQISPYLGDVIIGQTLSFQVTSVDKFTYNINLGKGLTDEATARIRLTLNYKNAAGAAVSTANLPVFCTDLYQGIGEGYYTGFTAVDATANQFPVSTTSKKVSANELLALRYLFGTTFGSVSNYLSSLSPTTTTWSESQIGGFQIALWEITHDTDRTDGFSLSSGSIKTASTDRSAAVLFAKDLLTNVRNAMAANTGQTMNLVVLESSSNQDLIFPYVELPSNIPPIPEPSTYAVGGAVSLLGLILYRRRKQAGHKRSR